MKIFLFLTIGVILLQLYPGFGQQIKFNRVIGNNNRGAAVLAMAQDQQGYMWISVQNKGLMRYDGSEIITYSNDPDNPNSLGSNYVESLFIDEANIIWIGLYGHGLDRYDPATTTFTHFRHHPTDSSSLSNDTVTSILKDKQGILWIGTHGGLNQFNPKTNHFLHFRYKENDTTSISSDKVRAIYEDRQGTIWIGTGSPFPGDGGGSEEGGLNRFDRTTGKFTRYRHNPNNPNSIASNKVRALFEDSKGNFWVGTAGDGLHTLDRVTGLFTHYYYDPAHPEKLSRPPLYKADPTDHITFITEDATGAIWIGSYREGINRYDPVTEKITHYGFLLQDNKIVSAKDTISGYKNNETWGAFISNDSLLWICTLDGGLYKINPFATMIPYYNINDLHANSFYYEPSGNILWIGTSNGLMRINLDDQNQKNELQSHATVLNGYYIKTIRINEEGKFWIGTNNGLFKFDPLTNELTSYVHDEKKTKSLSSNLISCLHIDHHKNIWIGAFPTGLDKMDRHTGTFINYRNNKNNINSLCNDIVFCLAEDKNNDLWIGTATGLDVLNISSGEFRHYLAGSSINSIFIDATGIVWAGNDERLYRFDRVKGQFLPYVDPNSEAQISEVLHIMEDDQKNLWISTAKNIVKINEKRDEVKQYGKNYGVHFNGFEFADNFKGSNGQIFMGDQSGFYAFFPDQLKDNKPPHIIFTSFKLGDMEINPIEGGVLRMPIWKTKEIKLNYHQNIFSFEFTAIDYTSSGEKKYLFMLENYNNKWRNIGADRKAYFFNVPPGSYIFRVKGINSEGLWDEKAISIIIIPPWWKTWWAYGLYGLLFIAAIWATHRYQKDRTIRLEREKGQKRELKQAKEIEKAYIQLKATQAQLIQSEKMASLGELTAGIAHEIQNPLNFVNNFSDVNTELIAELEEERKKENRDFKNEDAILKDLKENEQKINHHGKRAEAIVKGMLQHSRSSTGKKELTDINALADEYFRLSYHGLRAKDKSFNATMETDFSQGIEPINVIPQDIGRVILNLINNAFYAVTEKKKQSGDDYQPIVSVSTRKINSTIELRVKDNGIGIPQKVLDKIFQPFFTTKPSGQGTGLGLSMSYDIIKAHGGELKVETREGKGSEFIILLISS